MSRILLFGVTGMAGHVVYTYLKENVSYQIINVVFRNKLNEEMYFNEITSN